MKPWLIVVDDFLPRPDLVRESALKMTYAVRGHYPGLNSTEKINLEGLEKVVSQLVHAPVHAPWEPSFSHQNCRLSLASDNKPGRVHVDISHWTGVLSLSRNEDSTGGTEFYRHRRTGLEHMPMTPDALHAAGYQSYSELDADILQKDALDPEKWERTMVAPLRYNRLTLLRPEFWHTAGPGFGDSVENGRLVFLMFFKVQTGPGPK